MNKEITLKSNCIATIIPAGDEVTLAEGATFSIAQSLGNSVTLRDSNGMYRVGEDQLSALGEEMKKEVLQADQSEANDGPFEEKQIWDALRGCYDPEIPVNIVDLGLIYDLTIEEGEKGKKIFVKMTLTAQGCGMGPVIAEDAKTRVEKLITVESAQVEIVWDPQWNPRMISEEGKKVLGLE
ncbi:MAG: iron-sulfur cluster assembly protein [Verrucomicrobiota bacterium]|nr:iron-sulfur cluster assembly protein [Verrucomicrobiota bacterium]